MTDHNKKATSTDRIVASIREVAKKLNSLENEAQSSNTKQPDYSQEIRKISKEMDSNGFWGVVTGMTICVVIAAKDFSGDPVVECPIDATVGNTTQQFQSCVNNTLNLTGGDKNDYKFIPKYISPVTPK